MEAAMALPTNDLEDIQKIIKRLTNKEIAYIDVPKEYRLIPEIIRVERDLNIRKSAKRGYDIIQNKFFVYENVKKYIESDSYDGTVRRYFDDFSAYYDFLDGEIYNDACYYKFCPNPKDLETYKIDITKLKQESLIEYDIDTITTFEKNQVDADLKSIIKSKNYKGFMKRLKRTQSKASSEFFLYNLIFSKNPSAFDIVIEYLKDEYTSSEFEKSIYLIYGPEKVNKHYLNDNHSKFAESRKYEINYFINRIDKLKYYTRSYYDPTTYYFCVQIDAYTSNKYDPITTIYHYFSEFSEMADFLNNDLSRCDLRLALIPESTLSKYQKTRTTKLPLKAENKVCTLEKGYSRFSNNFFVKIIYETINGEILSEKEYSFDLFIDFVHFLKGDLSKADMLFCDGLINLSDCNGINFEGAKLRSNILMKFGIPFDVDPLCDCEHYNFPLVLNNENEISVVREMEDGNSNFDDTRYKIFYISDLHLEHRLKNADCKSTYDIYYVFQKIIDGIIECTSRRFRGFILIGGDVASNFDIFKRFITQLRYSLNLRGASVRIVFVLGNHELWAFQDKSFEEAIVEYRKLLNDNDMYLLQNDILLDNDFDNIQIITQSQLENIDKDSLRKAVLKARAILWCGIGFAGCNDEFNADNGIYRNAVTREQEIAYSIRTEKLYLKIKDILSDKRVVILTHCPIADWHKDAEYHSNYIYISGHNHKNYFYDDGDIRIYADNQIGYSNRQYINLKYLYVDSDYDIFVDYADDVYNIDADSYNEFYRGKNIQMSFSRTNGKIFMLKKNGYYCFLFLGDNHKLKILHGGIMKLLPYNNPYHYYDNMDRIIDYIMNESDWGKYSHYQKELSKLIKSIGGSGRIHGCIIDIDFFNHIYVNPEDYKITPYWARDMLIKFVYPTIDALLEKQCPEMYKKYKTLKTSKALSTYAVSEKNGKQGQLYLGTEIYTASRFLNRLQRLNSNILTVWLEPSNDT